SDQTELLWFYENLCKYMKLHNNIRKFNKHLNSVLNNYNITTEFLEIVSDSINPENLTMIMNKKIIPTQKCFQQSFKNPQFETISQIFINMGYVINYDDILQLIPHKKYISQIDPNIICDERISQISTKYNYHNYQKILKF